MSLAKAYELLESEAAAKMCKWLVFVLQYYLHSKFC